jgi:hypothetical protein
VIRFQGGPADGKVLQFRRTPLYLRVVQDGETFDVLDQLGDEPRAGEQVHVYRAFGSFGTVHIRPGGCWPTGQYRYLVGVDGDSLRTTQAWREWATAAPQNPTGDTDV